LQGKDVRANWNAVALAFLGDTVWEVTVYLSTLIQQKQVACTGQAFYKISQKCDCSCMHGGDSSIRQQKHPNTMKM